MNNKLSPEIIDEIDGFIVFNKPAGLLTHPTSNRNKETSLLDSLIERYPAVLKWGEELRQGIIHRLDKVTSGLLVCAYEEETFLAIKKEFAARAVKKTYYAFVENNITTEKGTISAPIGPDPRNKAKQKVIRNGRESVTEYAVVKRMDAVTLLHIRLITGRKHQIRTHLSYIGNPIINDKLYGGKEFINLPANSIALHSHNLQFLLKKTNYDYECNLPEYLEKLIY